MDLALNNLQWLIRQKKKNKKKKQILVAFFVDELFLFVLLASFPILVLYFCSDSRGDYLLTTFASG